MAKAAELRQLTDDELVSRLTEARAELFNLRFQHVTGQLDNYARLGQVRKDIARISTLLREREIAAAEALAAGSGGTALAAGSGGTALAAGSGGTAIAAGSGDTVLEETR